MGFETNAGEFMQAGSYSAAQLRRSVFGWAARTSANTPGLISGGLLSATDMQLSNAVSGLVVYTSVGECLIGGTEATSQGGYHGFLSSQNSTTLATANASNPRIDLICATAADAAYTIPTGGTSGYVTIVAVTGTPTSGATLSNLSGVGSLPASSLLLGYVLVPAAATNLSSGDIKNVATTVLSANWGVRNLAYATLNSNAAIAASGWQSMAGTQYNAVFDTGGNFNGSGANQGNFVAPVTGYYRISFACYGANITAGAAYVNNAMVLNFPTPQGSVTVKASAGQNITGGYYAAAATTLVAQNNSEPSTWMEIEQVA